jgi:hypothetical protein
MALSFEQTFVEVWRQTLVQNAKTVELASERYPVRRTPKRGLRQVDFQRSFLEQLPHVSGNRPLISEAYSVALPPAKIRAVTSTKEVPLTFFGHPLSLARTKRPRRTLAPSRTPRRQDFMKNEKIAIMVGASPTDIGQWEKILCIVAASLREEFKRQNSFEDDSDVSPTILALRDAFHAFPVPADVLLIDAGSAKAVPHYSSIFMGADFLAGPIWTLIAHHLGEVSGEAVRFHGIRALTDLDSYLPLLSESFGLDDESYRDSIKNLRFSGCWTLDCSEIVDFIPYDIRERPTDYGRYLAHNMFMSHADGLIGRFKKEIDFSAFYCLAKDPILPLEEWTKIDPTTAMFVKLADGKPLSIEERQEAVCDIQLIPKVPEDVRQTFRRAKDAYIFGYFRYDFFTMAVHYASLALEAAIKARWSASLPQKVTVSCGSDKVEMHFPSHTKIFEFCMKERWGRKKVLVDGNPFPFSSGMLLDWLVGEKIVTKWERKRLRNGLDMRNALSHVEHSSTDIPSSEELRFAATLINKLFHSLP